MAVNIGRNFAGLQPDVSVAGFIDVETTGLSPQCDEVVEFGMALFAFRPVSGEIVGIVEEYAGLRDPGRPIPPDATAVHGIRDGDVKGKRLDEERIRSLINRSEFLIAHNASFDRGFVQRLFPEAHDKPWFCSMNGVPWRRFGFVSRSLPKLLRAHRIPVTRAHRGADDVRSALRLLSCFDHEGACYFRHVLDRYGYRKDAHHDKRAGSVISETS